MGFLTRLQRRCLEAQPVSEVPQTQRLLLSRQNGPLVDLLSTTNCN